MFRIFLKVLNDKLLSFETFIIGNMERWKAGKEPLTIGAFSNHLTFQYSCS